MTQSNQFVSTRNPVEDLIRIATLYVEERRLSLRTTPTDASKDRELGYLFRELGQAVDALQNSTFKLKLVVDRDPDTETLLAYNAETGAPVGEVDEETGALGELLAKVE